jgi:hypothetical protein
MPAFIDSRAEVAERSIGAGLIIRFGELVTAGACKLAKRKIRVANQHSPLERTLFLTSLSGSRSGHPIICLPASQVPP